MISFFRKSILLAVSLCVFVGSFAETGNMDDITIADFTIQRRIDPFELSSISWHASIFQSKTLRIATGGVKKYPDDINIYRNQITIEKPIYKSYIAYAFNFAFASSGFSEFIMTAADTTLSIILRYPINLGHAGDIALKASGSFGFSSFLGGRSGTISGQPSDGEFFGNFARVIFPRMGSVKEFAYGLEYHFIKWLAVGVEMKSLFYSYPRNDKLDGDIPEAVYKDAFKMDVKNSLSFTVRVTF